MIADMDTDQIVDIDAEDEQDYAQEALESAIAAAEMTGLTVVEARPDQLFCDLDKVEDLDLFKKRVADLKRLQIVKSARIKMSKSGRWHGIVELHGPASVERRIMLQLMLGSDRVREYLCYQTFLKAGEETKILFFELPGEITL